MTTMTRTTIELTFEERFTVALMRTRMTKREFAAYVGITAKTLWRWETLRDEPNLGALRVLATESGFDLKWLRPSPEELKEGRYQYTPRDLNPEPTDWVLWLVDDLIAEAEGILEAVAR